MNRIGWSASTLASALAGAVVVLFPACAGAEIYGWVDPSGGVTYSNLPPPKDARVIEVIPETPPNPQAEAAAAAAHDAEMKALNERVHQLEQELRASRMESAPYPVSTPPPPPGYGAPSYPSYDTGPGYATGCDPEMFDCNVWSGPVYLTTGFAPWPWWGWWGYRPPQDFRHDHVHHHYHGPGGAPHFTGGPAAPRAAPHAAPRGVSYASAHAPSGGMGHGGR